MISVLDITIRRINYSEDGSPILPYEEVRKAIPLGSLPKNIQCSGLQTTLQDCIQHLRGQSLLSSDREYSTSLQ
jgi:hypothetical protein